MEELHECGECGKLFSSRDTLEMHAKRVHDSELEEEGGGLFSF